MGPTVLSAYPMRLTDDLLATDAAVSLAVVAQSVASRAKFSRVWADMFCGKSAKSMTVAWAHDRTGISAIWSMCAFSSFFAELIELMICVVACCRVSCDWLYFLYVSYAVCTTAITWA